MSEKTKEQIIDELERNKFELQGYRDDDERLRKEFSKAFGWYEVKNEFGYSREKEPVVKSWEQIFVEIGKLKSLMDYRDFDGTISELECAIEDIRKKLSGKDDG